MNSTLPDLPEEIRERYESLQAKLWRAGQPFRPNLSPGVEIPTRVSDKHLTLSEFNFILESISQYKLIVLFQSGEMGFGFEVVVMAHPQAGESHPTPLACFESKQVPDKAIQTSHGVATPDARKQGVWDLFEAIVQSEQNQSFLKFYKLQSHTRSQCEY